MKIIYIILTILFLSLNLIAQQKDSVWLKKRLTFILDSCKTAKCRGHEVYNVIKEYPNIYFDKLAFFEKYDTITSPSIRNNIFIIYDDIVYNQENPLWIKEALYKTFFFKMNEHKVSIYYGMGAEKNMKKEYFSQKTQDSIRYWINTKKTDKIDNENWLFLYAGFLEMKDLIPKIKEHVKGGHSSWENFWVMNIALARMGDAEALNYCLNHFKSIKRRDLWKHEEDIKYIKQGVIMDWFADLILIDDYYYTKLYTHSSGEKYVSDKYMDKNDEGVKIKSHTFTGCFSIINESISNYDFPHYVHTKYNNTSKNTYEYPYYVRLEHNNTAEDNQKIKDVKDWVKSKKGKWQFDRTKMY